MKKMKYWACSVSQTYNYKQPAKLQYFSDKDWIHWYRHLLLRKTTKPLSEAQTNVEVNHSDSHCWKPGVTLTQCQRRESFVKNFINTEIISVKSKGIFYAREKSRN